MGTTKDTREAVEAELEFDPLVDDADIHVVSINGDVALNGTVPSYPQYQRQHGDATRARPYLGRTRCGGQRRVDGRRRHAGP
jgi:osmotically-inducible protein OsmY